MDTAFGIVGPVLQLALVAAMAFRKLVGEFRFFFAYTIYSVLVIGVRLWATRSPLSYFRWYLATEIVYGILALLAIREAFRDALDSYYMRYKRTRYIPFVFLLVLVTVPFWWALNYPYNQSHKFSAALASGTYAFVTCVRFAEILIFVLFLSLKRRYAFRRYNAGVISGFGVYAFFMLLSYFLHSYLGSQFEWLYRYLSPGAYFGAAVVWLRAFVPPEEPFDKQPPPAEKLAKLRTAVKHYVDLVKQFRTGRPR